MHNTIGLQSKFAHVQFCVNRIGTTFKCKVPTNTIGNIHNAEVVDAKMSEMSTIGIIYVGGV